MRYKFERMSDKDIRTSSQHLLEMAEGCLKTAKFSIQMETELGVKSYYGTADRAFFVYFNCIRSVLFLEKVDFSSHSETIGYFQKNYIKTGIFERRYTQMLIRAAEIKRKEDHADYYIVTKEEAAKLVHDAECFFDDVKSYLENRKI